MKKEILIEVNRNREIMGLGPNRLLNEGIIGGIDDLIKLVTRKLSVRGTDAATTALINQFKNLTRRNLTDADKLDNILGFIRQHSNVFDDVFMRDFRKIFISKLPQGVQDEITVLKNAIEAGSVPEDKIYDLLTDSSQGIMRNADTESVNFMEDYLKTFLPKSTPNVGGVAAHLNQLGQQEIAKFADEVELIYASTIAKGGKKARIIENQINKIRELKTNPSQQVRNEMSKTLEGELNGVKDPWLRKYGLELFGQSRVAKWSAGTLIGIISLLILNAAISFGLGIDVLSPILAVIRKYFPSGDSKEIERRVNDIISGGSGSSGSGSSGGESGGESGGSSSGGSSSGGDSSGGQ